MTTGSDHPRLRGLLAAHGVTDMEERWGEIITCTREVDDETTHRWGHPSCNAYGYQADRGAAWEAARVHLTGCDRRRTPEDREASPDALVFSLLRYTDTGWQLIDELPSMPGPAHRDAE